MSDSMTRLQVSGKLRKAGSDIDSGKSWANRSSEGRASGISFRSSVTEPNGMMPGRWVAGLHAFHKGFQAVQGLFQLRGLFGHVCDNLG